MNTHSFITKLYQNQGVIKENEFEYEKISKALRKGIYELKI